MNDPHAVVLDELYVRIADGDISLRELHRHTRKAKGKDFKGRCHGPLSTFFLSKGRLRECEQALARGFQLVSEGVGLVELAGIKASLLRELGSPRISFALADRLVSYAFDFSNSILGMAVFDSAVAAYHCGYQQLAENRWARAAVLTDRSLYRSMAAVNLARIAADRRDYEEAKSLLSQSYDTDRLPKTLRASQLIIEAKLRAATGELSESVRLQSKAIEYYSHRGALDRAQLTIDLVIYMLEAGLFSQARETARSMAVLAFALEGERKEHAAATVLELARAAAAGPVTTSLAQRCLDALQTSNHEAQRLHSRDHASPRQK